MHYIRLLRPPSITQKSRATVWTLNLVLNITTDLGHSLLSPEQPVPLCVFLAGQQLEDGDSTASGTTSWPENVVLSAGVRPGGKRPDSIAWSAGMRVLKLELSIPAGLMSRLAAARPAPCLRIVASRAPQAPEPLADLPFDDEGRIVAVAAAMPRPDQHQHQASYMSWRQFAMRDGHVLHIAEEVGEVASLNRHLWDGGLVTAGLLADMCCVSDGDGDDADADVSSRWVETPLLKETLFRSRDVIELGCGVGILGIGLAAALHRRGAEEQQQERPRHILLTDLDDSEGLVRANVEMLRKTMAASSSSLSTRAHAVVGEDVVVEFECLDWEHAQTGALSPKAAARSWDLVMLSDCTYNVDMIPSLVETLSALHRHSASREGGGDGAARRDPKVLIATKLRHDSEQVLCDLMAGAGWAILEKAAPPLPLLGDEPELVELYLFGKAQN